MEITRSGINLAWRPTLDVSGADCLISFDVVCWDNDAFVNQQTFVPHVQSVANIKPVLSVVGFYRVPISLFHKGAKRSEVPVFFRSCGDKFYSQDLL